MKELTYEGEAGFFITQQEKKEIIEALKKVYDLDIVEEVVQ